MTASELKRMYQANNPDGHFFDRKTMSFFGDTMRNFGVSETSTGWELSRRRAVKYGVNTSFFFNRSCAQYSTVGPKGVTNS